jgi:hypothetical protein
MATALSDETPQLYVSCHAMLEALSQLVDRARWIGELRADATSQELLLPMAASIGFRSCFQRVAPKLTPLPARAAGRD